MVEPHDLIRKGSKMNEQRLKVMTVVGTRPEIIRLSRVIPALDRYMDHILVHTGQNFDYEMNEIFFRDLELRKPDYVLQACLLYTSDAADDLLCVDLGGRRIIKK